MTPLHWAVERDNISTVETLLRFGANVNVETKFGKSSLDISCDIGRPDIFEMLQNADDYRAPECPTKSDAITLAATQSILPNDDSFNFNDAFSSITTADQKKVKEESIIDNGEYTLKPFSCIRFYVSFVNRSMKVSTRYL